MDAMTKRVSLAELRVLKARETEYRAEREEWYRSGDGRRPNWRTDPETGRSVNYGGKGYTFPYCPHGKSLWTDYDNICGPCEDGYSVYQLALWNAQEKVAEYNRRLEWFKGAPASLTPELRNQIIDWIISVGK